MFSDTNNGTLVCRNCGLNAETYIISDNAEWRTFSDSRETAVCLQLWNFCSYKILYCANYLSVIISYHWYYSQFADIFYFQDPNRAGDAMSNFEGEAKGNILAGDGGILSDVISTANRALVNGGVGAEIHTHHIIMTT